MENINQKISYHIVETKPQKLFEFQEVKDYLRVVQSHDDKLIVNIISAAISAAENFTGFSLCPKVIKLTCSNHKIVEIILKYRPLLEILKIYILENSPHQLTNEQYSVDIERGILFIKTPLQFQNDLVVEYLVGLYEEDVPKGIKQGILLHIAEMYDREQSVREGLSYEVKNLYLPYRRIKI